MTYLDIISFEPAGEPKASPSLHNFLALLKGYEGVTSAWQGFQVEEPDQYYIVIFWDSLDHFPSTAKDPHLTALQSTLPVANASLQRKLFHINEYPELALAAPITDMTYMFLKNGQTFDENLWPILVKFSESKESGAQGAYWGKSTENDRTSVILIGWNSVQEHYDAGKLPAYKNLNDSAIPVVTFDLKHVAFENIFSKSN